MAFVRSRVDVTFNFDAITREVNQHAKYAVTRAAATGAQVASANDPGGPIQVGPTVGSVDGWVAYFAATKFHQWFLNYGTLGNRTKPLKRAPRTNRTRAPGTGVAPRYFLDAGHKAGRRVLFQELSRGIRI